MVLAGRVERARDTAQRAVAAGERMGNDQAVGSGLQALAMVALAEGYVDRAVSLAQRAVRIAQRNEAAWTNPRLWHGTALADADRLGEADVVLRAGRSEAEQTGSVARLPLYHWAIADVRLAAGDWDDATTEAQAGLALIEESATEVGDVFANAICAHVAVHRGELAKARAAVEAGPTQCGGWPARDRLRVVDLDRSVAGRGGWPPGSGPVEPVASVGCDRSRPLSPGRRPCDGARPRPHCSGRRGSPARRRGDRGTGAQRPTERVSDRPWDRVALPGPSRRRSRCLARSRRRPPRWASALPAGSSV